MATKAPLLRGWYHVCKEEARRDGPAELVTLPWKPAEYLPLERHLKHVRIEHERIRTYAAGIGEVPFPTWEEPVFWDGPVADQLAFLLAVNAMNFSYWPDSGQPKWRFVYQGQEWTGAMGLFAAFKDAIEKGQVSLDPQDWAQLDQQTLTDVLPGIPLLEARHQALVELGEVLLDDFAGDAMRLLKAAGGSASRLVGLLTAHFFTFDDSAPFQKWQVPFHKRAQLVAAMLHGRGLFQFGDVGDLVVFADYRVPQTLRKLGLVTYDEALAKTVSTTLIPYASREEVEIRLSAIIAAEHFRAALLARGLQANALNIDYHLWKTGKFIQEPDYPFHKTRSVYY